MTISVGEKLILVMLSDLYQHLGVQSLVDPARVKAAIAAGQVHDLVAASGGTIQQNDASSADVKFVGDVLMMWRAVENAYGRLTPTEKLQFPECPRFDGFDGNNEDELIDVGRYLTEQAGQFPEFSGRIVDAHGHRRSIYERMVAAYMDLVRAGRASNGLGVAELKEVVAARQFPTS